MMYSAKDNDAIEEIICGNNFEYILKNRAQFINTDYKVLQSQTNGIFIPCMKMERNGQIDLYYVTEEYTPMSVLLEHISVDTLMILVVNLFASVIEVRNNGFLACQCIDLNWNKIYVEQNTFKVKLIYLPLEIKSFDNYTVFESELRSSVIQLIDEVIEHKTERLNQFVSDLGDGLLSLEEVYRKTKNVGMPMDIGKSNNLAAESHISNEGDIKLVSVNGTERFELVIDQERTIIGKKQELVDKVIPFNKMISRKHCTIIRKNGNYYMKDEGSANGTYVNQHRLEQGKEFPIKRGDVVRLANSDFQIV